MNFAGRTAGTADSAKGMWADQFDQYASECVHGIGKSRKRTQRVDTNGQTRSSRSIPGSNMERDGSARTTERSAHASARVSSCPTRPHMAAVLPRPVLSTAVLATLRRRFGLVPHVVSLELMPLLAICVGLQCPTPRRPCWVASSKRHASYAFIRDPLARRPHTPAAAPASTPYEHTMKGRWPFSRKTMHDGEASRSALWGRDREWDRKRDKRRMPPPRQFRPSPARASPQRADPRRAPNAARPPRPRRPLRDRVYVPVKLARQLYADGEPVPWSDVNLLARWHLNSRRVPVPPVPRDGPEHLQEIRRRCALLPMDLRRDPAFDIGSLNKDTLSRWEVRPDRRVMASR
jgi:hypothetical protein